MITRLGPLALAATAFMACSGADSGEEDPGEDNGALVGGTDSGPQDDATLAVFRRGQPYCAATVIAPNVLLTALHCVADVDDKGIVGKPFQPYELTVHFGAKPTAQRAALVSKIVVPDAVAQAAGAADLRSNDIAALYVQPVDPAFAQIRPRTPATQPFAADRQVSVVGYTVEGQNQLGGFMSLRRQRRDGVYVWAGANDHSYVQAVLQDGRSYYWRNRPAELTTELVACGSDSGGPAFDIQGNLVGLVVGVVGECVPGSLSVFTDVGSHADFIQKIIGATSTVCLTDLQCGQPGSGKVCDSRTNHCMRGCRSGGMLCASGATCSAQGQPLGTIGICRSKSGPLDPSDPMYDDGPYAAPENAKCPGDPLCPPAAGVRECTTDVECKGVNGSKPRVCDIPRGRCLDGCRVNSAGMCSTGQTCGASQQDPQIGLCQAATMPAPPAGAPPASPPVIQSEPPSTSSGQPDMVTGPGSDDYDTGTTTKKKKKNKAKGGEGCSVGTVGSSSTVAFPLGLALLGLALGRRRSKRA
jgi:MYXO-CTERM domain-containing protein